VLTHAGVPFFSIYIDDAIVVTIRSAETRPRMIDVQY